jgi:hypothetical protein
MKPVFSARDETEAQLFKHVLMAENIRSVVLPGARHIYDERIGPVAVCVSDEDYERALRLAGEFRTPAPQNPWKWRCECGEDVEDQFALCWKCGRERPTE